MDPHLNTNVPLFYVTGKLQEPRVNLCGLKQLMGIKNIHCPHPGISVDFLHFMSKTLKFGYEFIPAQSWSEIKTNVATGRANFSLNFLVENYSALQFYQNLAPTNYFYQGFTFKFDHEQAHIHMHSFPPTGPFSKEVWFCFVIAIIFFSGFLYKFGLDSNNNYIKESHIFNVVQILLCQGFNLKKYCSKYNTIVLLWTILTGGTLLHFTYKSMVLKAMLPISRSPAFNGTEALAKLISSGERVIICPTKTSFYGLTVKSLAEIGLGPFRQMANALNLNPIKYLWHLSDPFKVAHEQLCKDSKVITTSSNFAFSKTKQKVECPLVFVRDADVLGQWESVIVNRNFSFMKKLYEKSVDLFPFMQGVIKSRYQHDLGFPSYTIREHNKISFGIFQVTFILWGICCFVSLLFVYAEVIIWQVYIISGY